MSNDIQWGERVIKVTIFFDNVRCIPEDRQRRRKCCACGRQAIYAQLNERHELVGGCKEDVWKARLLVPRV